MNSQSSGDRPPDESAKDGQPRQLTVSTTKSTLPSITRTTAPYQTLSKTLNRPVLHLQNVGGGIPSSAQTLQAILPAAGLLSGNIDASKSSLQQNPLNFSTLTPASTSSTPMMSSTQIVRVAAPGGSQPSIVQISAPASATSTSQHAVDGSILKHNPSAFPSHLPRGAAVAASVLAAPKSNTAVPMLRASHLAMPASSSATGIQVPRTSLISSASLRTTTPPATRAISPVVTKGTTLSEPHRQVKPVPSTTQSSTSSIQITLQPSRAPADLSQKQIISHQQPVQKPVHFSQKMLLTQTPTTQHSVLTKTNKASVPVSTIASLSPVSLGNLALTSAPISAINSLSAQSSIIPVAKVNPVRQQQPASISSHLPSRPQVPTTTHDHQRTEASSHPVSQPTPAPAHTIPHSQTQSAGLYLPQAHRPLTSTITLPGSVTGIDARTDRTTATLNPMTQLQLQYMISPEYQQLMYQQMAAAAAQAQVAQAGLPMSTASSIRPGLNINQTPNISATLQAVHGLVSTTQPLVDHSTMLMRQTPLSLYTPHSVNSSFTTSAEAGSIRSTTPKDTSSAVVSSAPIVMTTVSIPVPVPALSAIAMASSNINNLSTASSNLYINAAQTPGATLPQFQSSQTNNTPVTNANSSPRPSILRKRTNEGMTVVKKPVCGLNTIQEKLPDHSSPRPDSRTDSAPQSNTSSPKTPATPAGESQSSTDTALSSEATTPTQNALSDLRIKQEPPDTIENGFSNSNSLLNSTETSPRKKPRKQLLHVNEELKDSSSSDEDDYEDDKTDIKEEEFEFKDEYVDDEGVRWTLEKNRPNVSLLNFYNISWKSRNNHFQRYTDVKPKDERRPTVNELSNQRGVIQKASGWKLYHMAAQMEDLTGLEKTLHQKVLSLQETIAPQPVRQHAPEDDSGLLHELTQANLQRSKLIADQLEEARTSMLKVLDHKNKIFEIINKHMSKRPIKKKERS